MSGAHPLDGLILQAEREGAEAPEPGTPGAAPDPIESPNVGAIAFALTMFVQVATLAIGVKSLEKNLDEKAIAAVAGVLAPVADKYGWNMGEMLGGFSAEITAIAVAGPILWTAATQLNLELKARKATPVDQGRDDRAPS